jgi:hypothetical protein
MRRIWPVLMIPTLVGCVVDDEYYAPPPPPMVYAAPAVPNACSGGYRPTSPMYASPAPQVAMPQTAEPPR